MFIPSEKLSLEFENEIECSNNREFYNVVFVQRNYKKCLLLWISPQLEKEYCHAKTFFKLRRITLYRAL